MARFVKIPADPKQPIVDVEGSWEYPGLNRLLGVELVERVTSAPLMDELGTDESRPILVVDEEGRVTSKPYNERATVLYVPHAARDFAWIAGDALVVGEEMTHDGPDFRGVADHIGSVDIERVIDKYRKI